MKTVYDRDMVAHLWANQSQDTARVSSSNFWFTGPTLYSYGSHFVVGHVMPDAYNRDGGRLALMNADRYSNTTGRHVDAARQASRHLSRIFVHPLDENRTREISGFGAGAIVSSLIDAMRIAADRAANKRIKADTRSGLFDEMRRMREDALHLATVDASRRDLSPGRRKAARAQLKELQAADVDAFVNGASDKMGAEAFAFALNRRVYLDKMKQAADCAQNCAARALRFTQPADALNEAQLGERYAATAQSYSERADAPVPRAVVRALAKVKAGTKWRKDIEARVRQINVESARAQWAESEALARESLAACEFYLIDRTLSGDLRRAFETLHGEEGDAERREFVAELERQRAAWRAKTSEAQGREQLAAARTLFDAGKFAAANETAISAGRKLRCSFQPREGDASSNLINDAADLAKAAASRMPEEHARQLADWRDAKPGSRFPEALHNGDRAAFLRVSADGRRVETSQLAEVPVRVCAAAWQAVCAAKGTGRQFSPGEVSLGVFSLDNVDAEGNIRAGCHFIRFSELAAVAVRLGLTP